MTENETTTVPETCLEKKYILPSRNASKLTSENRIKKVVDTFSKIRDQIISTDYPVINAEVGHLNNYEIGLIMKKLQLAGYTVKPVHGSVGKDLIFSLRISW